MLFRFVCLSALLAYCNAINGDIPASSNLGSKILSKARRLDNADEDFSWVTNYDLKFHKCYTISQYEAEGGGDEGGSPVRPQHLVNFKLCPSGSCSNGSSSCSGGGDYVVKMEEFIQAFSEYKEQQQEYNCQVAENSCGCDEKDDDYEDEETCRANCYANAGYDYCGDEDEADDKAVEFEMEDYIECAEMEKANGNDNNYNVYYIGAHCASNGSAIRFGVFSDQQCQTQVDDDIYSKYNYGYELPYSSSSIVHRNCISCEAVQDADADGEDDNDRYEDPEVSELCEQVYEEAGKCETNMGSNGPYYKDEYSCDFIGNMLPALSNISQSKSGGNGVAKAFAWLFFISSCGLSGLAYYLHSKMSKSSVDLASQDQSGSVMA